MGIMTAALLVVFAAPEGAHWARSWSSIRAAAAKVAGVEAEFTQRKEMPLLSRPLVSKGRLRFVPSSQLRWEYVSPVKSLLELKDGQVRRYLWEGGRYRADSRQRSDAMQVVLGEITLWLSGRFQESRSFKAALRAGAEPSLVLTPLGPSLARFIRRVELFPSAQEGAIRKVVITEAGRASTTIEFHSCRVRYH